MKQKFTWKRGNCRGLHQRRQGCCHATKMELDRWIGSYKVRSFPWIDGKRIYFNVQYYAPGQSIEKPPVWDKTVYVTDNEEGRRLVYELTDSLVNHIACMEVMGRAIAGLRTRGRHTNGDNGRAD